MLCQLKWQNTHRYDVPRTKSLKKKKLVCTSIGDHRDAIQICILPMNQIRRDGKILIKKTCFVLSPLLSPHHNVTAYTFYTYIAYKRAAVCSVRSRVMCEYIEITNKKQFTVRNQYEYTNYSGRLDMKLNTNSQYTHTHALICSLAQRKRVSLTIGCAYSTIDGNGSIN